MELLGDICLQLRRLLMDTVPARLVRDLLFVVRYNDWFAALLNDLSLHDSLGER